ncbi:MAG: hypothetical protein QS748_04320 [Candidatus Endonucleobacter bathymodioli]|uniref:Uncharacterized protein n=1 Tax=Candidatus Endonucleibacter bathymodioli TaxID=539814 RepID=A0AA90NQ37_9GAMM|nr:hypothetical protein [Candidatus Endonucleobacter bathymodioli]
MPESISTLNIEDPNENKTPGSYTGLKFTPLQDDVEPNLQLKENTNIENSSPKDHAVSSTRGYTTSDAGDLEPLYQLSIRSPDGKTAFQMIHTKAELIDTSKDLDRTELEFFFANVRLEPSKVWTDRLKNNLRKNTYIQKIAVFAKSNDQETEAKFLVRLKNDYQCIKSTMNLCTLNHPDRRCKQSFIIPSIHTTTHLKTQDSAASKTSRCFYISGSYSKFNEEYLRSRYSIISPETQSINLETQSLRHPFSILPYSEDVDATCEKQHGEKLFDTQKNYLAITQMACIRTNWNPYSNLSEFSCPIDDDYDDVVTDGTNTTHQQIIGTDYTTTAGQYKLIDTDLIEKNTKCLCTFSPVISIIFFLNLDPNIEKDRLSAIHFLDKH